jgi:predicted ATPase
VLFLDDLQWTDPSTLEFLGYLLTQKTRGKMLCVGCYRREEITPELATLIERVRSVGEILRLERLSRSEVKRLVSQAKISDSLLAQRIYHETQGNPFFIATVLQHLASAGILQEHHDHWALTVRDLSADYSKLFIPPDVQQAIRQRLAKLDERERQCLELEGVQKLRDHNRWLGSQTLQQEVHGSKIDHRFTALRPMFVILTEPPIASQPGTRALHHPTTG